MKTTAVEIAGALDRIYGTDASRFDCSFLDKTVQKRITETHCNSQEEYCALIEQNRNEGEEFMASLYISYSEFFRNPLTFAVLEKLVLPSLILNKKKAGGKETRIWSAACAAGQESYSLAMLMEEFRNDRNEQFSYRIFATDQDEAQIVEAQRGKYNKQSLNNLALKRLNKWFTNQGDFYFVKQGLKAHIDFTVFDLFNERLSSPPASIFGDFDLVFCANLLFYYKPEFQKIIFQKTGNAMAKGGFLVVGEVEREIMINYGFKEVYPHSAIFRK